jgi:hypothetical protein
MSTRKNLYGEIYLMSTSTVFKLKIAGQAGQGIKSAGFG